VSNIIYENKIWPHEQDFGILPKRGALPAELHHEGGGGEGTSAPRGASHHLAAVGGIWSPQT
jgi:hypothetical protein